MKLGRVSRNQPPRFRRAVWLYPAAFAVHVLEEVPGSTKWAQRHTSERYTQRDFVRNNAAGMVMTLAGTALVSWKPTRRATFLYFALVLTQQAPFNAVFHAGTTVAYRTYSPGLATSLAQLPLWYHLTRLACREGLLTGMALYRPRQSVVSSTPRPSRSKSSVWAGRTLVRGSRLRPAKSLRHPAQ